MDRARAKGIWIPIWPGILPIRNFAQASAFAEDCGANVPDFLADLFNEVRPGDEVSSGLSAMVTLECCRFLQERGVDNFHFFTLNRADVVLPVSRVLALQGPREEATAMLEDLSRKDAFISEGEETERV